MEAQLLSGGAALEEAEKERSHQLRKVQLELEEERARQMRLMEDKKLAEEQMLE